MIEVKNTLKHFLKAMTLFPPLVSPIRKSLLLRANTFLGQMEIINYNVAIITPIIQSWTCHHKVVNYIIITLMYLSYWIFPTSVGNNWFDSLCWDSNVSYIMYKQCLCFHMSYPVYYPNCIWFFKVTAFFQLRSDS